jgi:hypothetical protein
MRAAGKVTVDRGALAELALEADAALVQFDQRLHDRQSEAGPRRAGTLGLRRAGEGTEQILHLVFGDAATGVPHREN